MEAGRQAYVVVQRNAMKVWDEGKNFRELLGAEPPTCSRCLLAHRAGRVPSDLQARAFATSDAVFRPRGW